jgi:hypothetical protein
MEGEKEVCTHLCVWSKGGLECSVKDILFNKYLFFLKKGSIPGALFKINGIMNFTQYQDIFFNLVASDRMLKLGRKCIFQQDGNLKHIIKSTNKWLWKQNQHFAMAISVSGLETNGKICGLI